MAAPAQCPLGLFYQETPFDALEAWIDYDPPSVNPTGISGGDLVSGAEGQPGHAQVLTLPARPVGAEVVIIKGNFSVKFSTSNFSDSAGGFYIQSFDGLGGTVWYYQWHTKLFGGDGSGFYFRRVPGVGSPVDLVFYPTQGPHEIELKLVADATSIKCYLDDVLVDTLAGKTFWGNTGGVPHFVLVGKETASGALYTCHDYSIVGPGLAGTACPVPPLDPPDLSTPADLATGVPINPVTLTWQASAGAVGYQVQIAEDAGFVFLIANETLGNVLTLEDFGGPENNFTYYWRVKAIGPSANDSDWSEVWSFTTASNIPDAPTLIAPADDSAQIFTGPLLQWQPVAGATFYQVDIATDAGFSAIVYTETGIAGTSHQVPGATLAQGVEHFWRARASND